MKHQAGDFDDRVTFIRVVESGSFTRAAVSLQVSKSIVSRRVARLEKHLGVRLVTRGPQGAHATQVGIVYARELTHALNAMTAADEIVIQSTVEIAGPIRIALPPALGIQVFLPVLSRFIRQHSGVEIDVVLNNEYLDPRTHQFDLALRAEALPDSALVARRIGNIDHALAASPGYLDQFGRPAHPHDLVDHNALINAPSGLASPWLFRIDDDWQKIEVAGSVKCNDVAGLLEFAIAGSGIANLPSFLLAPALTSGRLEVVLDDWPQEAHPLSVVFADGRQTTQRVRALAAYLESEFSILC